MKFIKDNPLQFLSVKLPIYGALLIGVLPTILEHSIQLKLIPIEYHAIIVSVVLPALALLGRQIAQPDIRPLKPAPKSREK